MSEGVKRLVGEGRVDHIDMNFGCPVRKVTRKGGGAAIPAKPRLLESIVRAAVENAGDIPVTIKFRMGIDDDWMTFLETGRIAEAEGVRAIALHARTAAQLYDGEADWRAIGELKQAVTSIPVLGNGDIWEAWDALRMMRATGCDGVVVGRGCLGRPWLFRDLAEVFAGEEPPPPPDFGEVIDTMREHARLLCGWVGERIGIRDFRKHATWYTKGFPGSTQMRDKLIRIDSLAELDEGPRGGRSGHALPARGNAHEARQEGRSSEGPASGGLPERSRGCDAARGGGAGRRGLSRTAPPTPPSCSLPRSLRSRPRSSCP